MTDEKCTCLGISMILAAWRRVWARRAVALLTGFQAAVRHWHGFAPATAAGHVANASGQRLAAAFHTGTAGFPGAALLLAELRFHGFPVRLQCPRTAEKGACEALQNHRCWKNYSLVIKHFLERKNYQTRRAHAQQITTESFVSAPPHHKFRLPRCNLQLVS